MQLEYVDWMREVKNNVGSIRIVAVGIILTGIVCLMMPMVTGVAVDLAVGVIMLLAGILQLFHGFHGKQWRCGAIPFISGLLSVVCGALMLFRPVFGLSVLTLLLVGYFVIDGITSISYAIKFRPGKGWSMLLFSGIVTLALGLFVGMQWPLSGVWAIGILLGVNLLMAGIAMLSMSFALQSISVNTDS